MQCGRSCGIDGVGLHPVRFHELGIKRRSACPGCPHPRPRPLRRCFRSQCLSTQVSAVLAICHHAPAEAGILPPTVRSGAAPSRSPPDRARDPLSAAFPPGTCAMPCAARRCASCHAAIRYFFPFAGVLSASSAKTATSIPWLPGARCASRNEVRCLCEPRASFGLSELRCLSSKAPNDRGKIEAARQNCVE